MSNKSLSSLATPPRAMPRLPFDRSLSRESLATLLDFRTKAADPLQDQRKRELIKSLLGLGVAGLGLGAGARAGVGLHQLMAGAKPNVARTSSIPETIPVPVLEPDPTQDDTVGEFDTQEHAPLQKLAQLLKQADLGDTAANMVPQPLVDAIPNLTNSGHPLKSWQGMPMALAAGGAGLMGGWSLMDWLAKHRRKSEQQQDVTDARDEFREALANEYRTAMSAKQASEAQSDPLEQAFERWQQTKEAGWPTMPGYKALLSPGGPLGPSSDPQAPGSALGPQQLTQLAKNRLVPTGGQGSAQATARSIGRLGPTLSSLSSRSYGSGHTLSQAENNAVYGQPTSPGFAAPEGDAIITARKSIDPGMESPRWPSTGSPAAGYGVYREAQPLPGATPAIDAPTSAPSPGVQPVEKSGNLGQQVTDWGNLAGGLYGATALALGAGTGYATYKATKARSARKILQKAIEARARQRAAPQPVYAVPTGDLAAI
jgi:hypothetical protein